MSESTETTDSSWPTVRRKVLERDGYTCQDCGAAVGRRSNPHLEDAEVHHETPRAEGGSDDPENLITLCSNCHCDREPPVEGRNGAGQFTLTYTPEDFLDAVEELDLPTTGDVADRVGCAHRTALHHLNNLEEEGRVTSRNAGRAKLWMLANDE